VKLLTYSNSVFFQDGGDSYLWKWPQFFVYVLFGLSVFFSVCVPNVIKSGYWMAEYQHLNDFQDRSGGQLETMAHFRFWIFWIHQVFLNLCTKFRHNRAMNGWLTHSSDLNMLS
jgi:hypothetical protein